MSVPRASAVSAILYWDYYAIMEHCVEIENAFFWSEIWVALPDRVAHHNIFWAGGMVTQGGSGIIVSGLKIQEI